MHGHMIDTVFGPHFVAIPMVNWASMLPFKTDGRLQIVNL